MAPQQNHWEVSEPNYSCFACWEHVHPKKEYDVWMWDIRLRFGIKVLRILISYQNRSPTNPYRRCDNPVTFASSSVCKNYSLSLQVEKTILGLDNLLKLIGRMAYIPIHHHERNGRIELENIRRCCLPFSLPGSHLDSCCIFQESPSF